MITVFKDIITKKRNIVSISIMGIVMFVILRLIPQWNILKNFFSLSNISFERHMQVLWEYLFKTLIHATWIEWTIDILFPILISINIIVFIAYVKRQRRLLSKRGMALSISGMVLGFFGVGCLSCGALVLAPLISLLGLGGLVKFSNELALLGLVFIIASIVFLLWKLTQPIVCKPE